MNNTHDTIDHDSSPEELEFESSAEGLPSSTRKRRNNSDVATPLSKRARKSAVAKSALMMEKRPHCIVNSRGDHF